MIFEAASNQKGDRQQLLKEEENMEIGINLKKLLGIIMDVLYKNESINKIEDEDWNKLYDELEQDISYNEEAIIEKR
ncbi:MAG: hypothetical protein PHS34_08645 [Candidatus Omnitrophica bacterium]|nr:hypothetical protein [Candidatus Omnitrophota bacterium]